MGEAIDVSNLVKIYGSVRALDGLDLEEEEGEIHGFLGPNGAGKTTTIRILTGLLRPDEGTARIFGEDTTDGTGVRAKVGYMPELPSFPTHLTGQELLDIYGRLYGLGKSERRSQAQELLELVDLEGSGDRRIGEYSKGMRQRLGVAQSLLGDPNLVIMDEPTAGLDPEGRVEVREIVERVGSEATVFLSSHLLEDVEKMCTHVTIIRQGKELFSGSVEDISKKFSQGAEISLEVSSLEEEVIESVKKIPQVKDLGIDGNELTVLVKSGADIRGKISRAIFEAGGDILAMAQRRQSVEDFFLEVTKGENKG